MILSRYNPVAAFRQLDETLDTCEQELERANNWLDHLHEKSLGEGTLTPAERTALAKAEEAQRTKLAARDAAFDRAFPDPANDG